jgi:hypothetical protein
MLSLRPQVKATKSALFQWIDPLKDGRWPDVLAAHARSSVFQSRGWLEALQRTYGYEPAALIRTSPGRAPGGVVFCRIKSWLTGPRLVSVPFSDYCDALVADDEDLLHLGQWLEREMNVFKYIELRPRNGSPMPPGQFKPAGRYWHHRLELKPDARDVLPAFHKNHIARKIRRSESERLVYEEGRSDALLRAFYDLQIKTRRRHGLPPQPIAWFRNILDCLPDQAKIRVAFKGQTPIAAIITLRDRRDMIYKYGASDAQFHSMGGMQFLLWRTIQEACALGCASLDLGRSREDSYGELAFKDHWGAGRTPLVYLRYPGPLAKARVSDAGSKLAARVFSLLPERLLVAAGGALYRHIG